MNLCLRSAYITCALKISAEMTDTLVQHYSIFELVLKLMFVHNILGIRVLINSKATEYGIIVI